MTQTNRLIGLSLAELKTRTLQFAMRLACMIGGVLLMLGFSTSVSAIDLQPGEIAVPPPGMNFVQLNFVYSERGDLYAANQKVSNATKLINSQFQARYIHTFNTGELPSVVYVQTPLGQVQPQKALRSFYTNESGVGDTTLVYAIWPYADREEKKYWALGTYLTLPTGHYDAGNGLINLGGNRYSVALQTAYQRPISQSVSWMAAVDAVWFGNNDNYFDHQLATQQKTLKQDALYTAQTGLAYDLSKQFSLAAAYFYTEGGQRILDNVAVANSTSQMQRYQLTATARFSFATMMLQYGDDISTKNGYIEDSRVIFRVIKAF